VNIDLVVASIRRAFMSDADISNRCFGEFPISTRHKYLP
jgi:hypothetical protein